ncbi:DNA polymerase III subunit delta [Roseomonas marmotae]|uniref:DNA-directed DNA polymerase n=1 Tax=Roseomonas marmotae TaxID=2768161 RepID=A0ABS3KGT7_9PROT|nr:DNA polymerase III subunit delta [Roseomonas marmotae]MBO1076693.1 DNA polymerase III subunit delta [Roseomonas marmotae]QTI79845.1 DNA polymerase III subunit delta [Roseomonas marmotae]
MAKLDARRLPAFLKDPGATRVVLLHGEDAGLVRERAEALQQAVVGGDDPFRLAELPREAAAKPGALSAEISALALTGGRRLVRVRDATDALTAGVKEALAAPGDALLLLEAGELPARAKLRALLEPHSAAAVIACYRERGPELTQTIATLLREQDVTAEPSALEWLAGRLGEDRMMLRREVEKLALYAGRGGRLGEEDVLACIGDGSTLDLDEALIAATAGEIAVADRALDAALGEGAHPVMVVRAALRHVQRLHLAALAMAGGASASSALEGLRPPVFFRHKGGFERALRCWSAEALAAAGDALLEAEKRTKSSSAARPIPDQVIARGAVLALARQALAARRRG